MGRQPLVRGSQQKIELSGKRWCDSVEIQKTAISRVFSELITRFLTSQLPCWYLHSFHLLTCVNSVINIGKTFPAIIIKHTKVFLEIASPQTQSPPPHSKVLYITMIHLRYRTKLPSDEPFVKVCVVEEVAASL